MDYDDYKDEFEDEEDDDENESEPENLSKKTRFEEFYKMNPEAFPGEFREVMDRFLELKHYILEVEPHFNETIDGPLTRLMKEQYPCMKTNNDPKIIETIHDINDMVGHELIGPVRIMLEDVASGVDFRKKYPDFEYWKKFYGNPPDTNKVPEVTRYIWFTGTDEEWEEHKAEEIRAMQRFNRWCQSRLQSFYDIVQPEVFAAFPNLINIEGDAWVIYAMNIRDAYENWKDRCESLEIVIEYQMPPESFHWSPEKYREAMKNTDPALQKKYDEGRKARIEAHP